MAERSSAYFPPDGEYRGRVLSCEVLESKWGSKYAQVQLKLNEPKEFTDTGDDGKTYDRVCTETRAYVSLEGFKSDSQRNFHDSQAKKLGAASLDALRNSPWEVAGNEVRFNVKTSLPPSGKARRNVYIEECFGKGGSPAAPAPEAPAAGATVGTGADAAPAPAAEPAPADGEGLDATDLLKQMFNAEES